MKDCQTLCCIQLLPLVLFRNTWVVPLLYKNKRKSKVAVIKASTWQSCEGKWEEAERKYWQLFVWYCDLACENWAYLHKLHIFRQWYFSWFLLKIFMFGELSLLSYWTMNKVNKFHCYSLCCSKDIISWSSKIRQNFVCRYALLLHVQSLLMLMISVCINTV